MGKRGPKPRVHRLSAMALGRWRCTCGRVFTSAAEFSAHVPPSSMLVSLNVNVPADLVAQLEELAAQGWRSTSPERNGRLVDGRFVGGVRISPRTQLIERALRWYVERHAPARRVA